jgi:hypothetical protein
VPLKLNFRFDTRDLCANVNNVDVTGELSNHDYEQLMGAVSMDGMRLRPARLRPLHGKLINIALRHRWATHRDFTFSHVQQACKQDPGRCTITLSNVAATV